MTETEASGKTLGKKTLQLIRLIIPLSMILSGIYHLTINGAILEGCALWSVGMLIVISRKLGELPNE